MDKQSQIRACGSPPDVPASLFAEALPAPLAGSLVEILKEALKRKTNLRLKQVMARTGLGRSAIYYLSDPKSPRWDPLFPPRIKISARAVAWDEASLDIYIESRRGASAPTAS